MRVGVLLTVVISACGIAGCNAPEAKFVVGEAAKELIRPAERAVTTAVNDHFGTPHKLVAWEKLPVDFGKLDGAASASQPEEAKSEATTQNSAQAHGDAHGTSSLVSTAGATTSHPKTPGWQLLDGRNLYMKHCLHCHGVSGDGNGPTAQYLNPRPRDYRLGIFKFTSTVGTAKVRRDDLHLILKNGIPGTSMPSFALLKEGELTAIVEYVRWLAMRGEFETKLAKELATDYSIKAVADRVKAGENRREIDATLTKFLTGEDGQPAEFLATVKDVGENLALDWEAAEDESNLIVPKFARQLPSEDPHTIERGRALYMSEKLKCYSCHGLGAKGDGGGTVDYWPIPGSTPEKKYAVRGLHDTWGNPIKPRNLTLGQFRGGRRPVDLYRRIYAGIKGTQMAGFNTALREDKDEQGNALTEEQIAARLDRNIWDLVNYVLDVPHQKQTIAPVMPMTAQSAPAAN